MKWSNDEKQKLVNAAKTHTINNRVNWNRVALLFPGRTANQCRVEYCNRTHTNVEIRNIVWG